jgi:hypothetical protein
MARSRSRADSGARSSSSKAAKKPRKTSSVEVVEENNGGGVDAAIAIFTMILLVAGFLMLDYELGKHYGAGALFADSYEAPQG